MAHIKALRNRWLAAFAEQQGEAPPVGLGPARPPADGHQAAVGAQDKQEVGDQRPSAPQQTAQNQQQQRQANGGALLPKKRLLEAAAARGGTQPASALLAKKQRQGEPGTAAASAAVGGTLQQQQQQQRPKPQQKGEPSRVNGEARVLSGAKPGNKLPAAGAGAGTAAAVPAGRPAKREGASAAAAPGTAAGGSDTKASRPASAKEPGKGSAEKAAAKQVAAAERAVKKEQAAAERPPKKEQQAAGKAAGGGDKSAKSRLQAEANGRPVKPVPAAAAAAAKPAAIKQEQPPQQQQQQEHAGSNPSSMQRDAGTAVAEQRQQHQQQATSPVRPGRLEAVPGTRPGTDASAAAAAAVGIKTEPSGGVERGSGNLGTPVEVLLSEAEPALAVGEVVVTMYRGHTELWEAVRARFADRLPSGAAAKARLVYQDSDGDWLLLQPQAPWQVFTRTVRKLVVTCK